eukprot:CAMPEP_0195292538 /NCGR_PEP_ID=MMETSP0707-20130614/10003_1 /TAXON_ID=33640 /ORGANISM="Asterionellopsis glacialis, Strain CCMP134" /LENGTH=291 /DNA_ID=CAMNT_0040353025 /DNA_START=332 /DNA_END=1207 /DNA_ORIENTATION=+
MALYGAYITVSTNGNFGAPSRTWYHYYYVPKSKGVADANRNLVIVQTGLVVPLTSVIDITSRPNRAYAKYWGMDYLKYTADHQSTFSLCYDRAVLLHEFVQEHERQREEQRFQTQSEPQRVYDRLLFLPGDSIITDYEFDLTTLLPEDKLVGIATHALDDNHLEDKRQTDSRIFMWNLNHKDSRVALNFLLDLLNDDSVSCEDENDLVSLLAVVETQFRGSKPGDISSHVQYLQETSKGFLAPRLINFDSSLWSPSKSIKSGNDLVFQVEASRETVADSVCYRYYPRCEVI